MKALFASLFLLVAGCNCTTVATPEIPAKETEKVVKTQGFTLHSFIGVPWGTSRDEILAWGAQLDEEGRAVVVEDSAAFLMEFADGKLVRGTVIQKIDGSPIEVAKGCDMAVHLFEQTFGEISSNENDPEVGPVLGWRNNDTMATSICLLKSGAFIMRIELIGAPESDKRPAKPSKGVHEL